jgi:hypothetical protein
MSNAKHLTLFTSLCSLWAFVESGLGGILHAFHLPFTGIILGGFSVLIIRLLALSVPNPFKYIVSATLVVIAIKAAVNPATSPMAYIAVFFQGMLGAIVYSINKHSFISHICFAVIAMAESALQQLLVIVIFFQEGFTNGLAALSKQVNKSFGLAQVQVSPTSLILAYLAIFIVWGILLAIYMHNLPKLLHTHKPYFALMPMPNNNAIIPATKKSKTLKYVFIIMAIVGFILLNIFSTNKQLKSVFYLKVILIILLWQLLIAPILKKAILAWSNKYSQKNTLFTQVQNQLPAVASSVTTIYNYVNTTYTGYKKWKLFFIGLIIINTDGDW